MKKRLLLFGLLMGSLGVVSAEPPESPPPWAEKVFGAAKNRTHDFGIVPPGFQLRHSFVLKNIYAVPVEIADIHAT
jgi:hypothetical protein